MYEILLSIDFWKFAAPLFGAIIAWFVNEGRKREWEQYQRKEERYRELVRCLKGFYIDVSKSTELRAEFLSQLNFCWLYCPDDVIQTGYAFLNTVHTDNPSTKDEVKEQAVGDFIASVRKDLLSRRLTKSTKLTGEDFKHLRAN